MSKCSNPKCTSGKPGRLMPVLLLWPKSMIAKQPAHVNLDNITVCHPCSLVMEPRHFIDSLDMWISIVNEFKAMGKAIPNLKTAKVTYLVPETKFSEDLSQRVIV